MQNLVGGGLKQGGSIGSRYARNCLLPLFSNGSNHNVSIDSFLSRSYTTAFQGCFDSKSACDLNGSRPNSLSLSQYLGNLNLGATRFYSSSINPPPNNGDVRPMTSSIYPPPSDSNGDDVRPMRSSSMYPPPNSGDPRPMRSSIYPPPTNRDVEPLRSSNNRDVEPQRIFTGPPPNNRDVQPRRMMDFVREIGEDSRDLNSSRYGGVEQNADIVHIKLIRNNTFVTITDYKGDKKVGASYGCLKEMKSGPKNSRFAAEATAEHVGKLARNLGLKSVVMKVNGFTYFTKKKKAIMSWREGYTYSRGDLNPVVYIEDTTRRAHNGCRLRKKRRI